MTSLIREPQRLPGDCRLRHLPSTKDSRTREQAKRDVARAIMPSRARQRAIAARTSATEGNRAGVAAEVYAPKRGEAPSRSPSPTVAD